MAGKTPHLFQSELAEQNGPGGTEAGFGGIYPTFSWPRRLALFAKIDKLGSAG